MILEQQGQPLRAAEIPIPAPGPEQLLIRIHACGVCRTDLHIVDGDLPNPKLPLVPGHQIVGQVQKIGNTVQEFQVGDRIGVPWLQGSCGKCNYCQTERENLCDNAIYTGYQVDGGFAEYCVANAKFAFSLPPHYSDIQAAPLLCAGLIGYRSLKLAGEARNIGFYGFGASAHLLAQVVRHQGGSVYAFTRPGDTKAQQLARDLGAVWAGDSDEKPPVVLDAAIIFAPVGELVPAALRAIGKGGTVVCAGIHMSDIPSFPYDILWEERCVRSVANLTREDGREFLMLAHLLPLETHVVTYPLERVNEALADLRAGRFSGAAVITLMQDEIKKE
ncbi:MAG: zinc-dependent alcohol dehydrogenase family protein [Parachlamydia sp.]|nr:zinc-dependent alcohol dehydrogenase family protein [Parachlamydia sp.]